MKTSLPHTSAFCTALFVAILLLWSVAPALADRAGKKSTSFEKSTTSQAIKALRAGSAEGAVDATLRALATRSTPFTKTTGKSAQATSDTSVRKDSKILFARATSDVFTTKIELVDDEQQIELGIYNMLGKKIQDVHRGAAARGIHEYTTPISDLPEGVYICILQGKDIRKAEKFFISR